MEGGTEHKNKQSLSGLMFSEPMMKRATKLLVSVSVFSVVFSYMSWRSHPILAIPTQLLSHALNKNYMFLVCNGILVLLAKTSRRVARAGPAPYDDDLHPPPPHANLLDSLLHKESLAESRLLLENADSDDDDDDEKHVIEEEEEEEKHVIEEDEEEEKLVIEEDEDANKEEDDSRSLMVMMVVGDKQDEEEDDGFLKVAGLMEGADDEVKNGVLIEEEKEVAEERERLNKMSAEELNKKFEEFIRKMKEDIRIEARQQHIVLVK